jgi:hypothetical protein
MDGRSGPGPCGVARRWAMVTALALAAAGCAGQPSAPGPSGSAAPSGAAAPVPGVPATASVPLTLARSATGFSCAVASVTVGGGPPVRVVVDTGAPGLTVVSTALGPDARPTGRQGRAGFVGSSFPVTLVRARVGIGGVGGPTVLSTPRPVLLHSTPAALHLCGGAEGNLGIGAGNPGPGAPPPMESPLVQLPAPLSDGFTLSLTGGTGTLTAGKPAVSARAVVLPLPTENGHYPDGRQAYQRDPTLCWTVGPQHGCGPTNVDSGFSFPAVRPDLLPGAGYPAVPSGRVGPVLPAGTEVTVTSPQGQVVESFRTAAQPREQQLRLTGLFGGTRANTGIGIFQTGSVADDLTTGQLIITPR